MAGTRVEETYTERDQTIDAKENVTEIEIPYIVTGASDEDAALSAARSTASSHTVKGVTIGENAVDVIHNMSNGWFENQVPLRCGIGAGRISGLLGERLGGFSGELLDAMSFPMLFACILQSRGISSISHVAVVVIFLYCYVSACVASGRCLRGKRKVLAWQRALELMDRGLVEAVGVFAGLTPVARLYVEARVGHPGNEAACQQEGAMLLKLRPLRARTWNLVYCPRLINDLRGGLPNEQTALRIDSGDCRNCFC